MSAAASSTMRNTKPYAEIFLLSLGVILLEVSYTRIFSYKLVYYFTYLIIGIALLVLAESAAAQPDQEGLQLLPLRHPLRAVPVGV